MDIALPLIYFSSEPPGLSIFNHCLYLLIDNICKGFGCHGSEVAGTLTTHTDGAVGYLLLAEDQHEGHLGQFGVAYLATYLLATLVDDTTQSKIFEASFHLTCLVDIFLADGQHDELFGCEPQRELTCRVLNEHGYKTPHDVRKLLDVLQRIVNNGDTVIVIEHNLDVIKNADYIIDLGPEGGDDGGEVVACGTPEQVAAVERSYTGQYLKKILNGGELYE